MRYNLPSKPTATHLKMDSAALIKKADSLERKGRLESAFSSYFEAAQLGSSTAQYKVGSSFEYGEGVKPNAKKALAWYSKAWKTDQQAWIATALYRTYAKTGSPRQANVWHRKAIELLQRAAAGGDVDATFDLANHLVWPNRNGSTARAMLLFRRVLKSRRLSPERKETAARMIREHRYKEIIEKADTFQRKNNFRAAIALFQQAARGGVSLAELFLGDLYAQDLGDLQKAIFWHKRAVANGRIDSISRVAELYVKKKDNHRATQWWRRAVAAGDGTAALDLAKLLISEEGIKRQRPEILRLLKLAVNAPHPIKISLFDKEKAARLLKKLASSR